MLAIAETPRAATATFAGSITRRLARLSDKSGTGVAACDTVDGDTRNPVKLQLARFEAPRVSRRDPKLPAATVLVKQTPQVSFHVAKVSTEVFIVTVVNSCLQALDQKNLLSGS